MKKEVSCKMCEVSCWNCVKSIRIASTKSLYCLRFNCIYTEFDPCRFWEKKKGTVMRNRQYLFWSTIYSIAVNAMEQCWDDDRPRRSRWMDVAGYATKKCSKIIKWKERKPE